MKKLTESNVAKTAINIPSIPKILPLRELSGDDKSLRAMIKKIPEIT